MTFAPLFRTAAMALVAIVVLLSACGGQRYDVAPDATWKERDDYCFFFQVDPQGSHNNNVGWTDTEPVVEATEAGFILTAVEARVGLNFNSTSYHGDAGDDYFRPFVLWTTDGEGLVNVERLCADD